MLNAKLQCKKEPSIRTAFSGGYPESVRMDGFLSTYRKLHKIARVSKAFKSCGLQRK